MKDATKSEEQLTEELEQLRERLEACQLLAEAPFEGVVIHQDARVIQTNPAFARMLGYDPDEVIGLDGLEVVAPGSRDAVAEHIAAGDEEPYVATMQRKDGTTFPAQLRGKAMSYQGRPVRVATVRDITELQEREEMLREREQELRNLTESLGEAVYRADPETFEATYVNPAIEDIYGYTAREWLADPELWADSIHPEDRERVFAVFSELQEHHRNDVVQYRIVTRDGETRWVEDHVSWQRNQAGDVVSMNGVMYDVTERKRAQRQLRQQAEEILELSTPVIQVWEGVLAVPLIGTLDSQRTQRFAEDLLEAIVTIESPVVLVDITGVPTIDTQTAHHLIETIAAVRLLGSDVVLTGVRPAIAQTLVHLGIDLSGITTHASLAAGLRDALATIEASL